MPDKGRPSEDSFSNIIVWLRPGLGFRKTSAEHHGILSSRVKVGQPRAVALGRLMPECKGFLYLLCQLSFDMSHYRLPSDIAMR